MTNQLAFHALLEQNHFLDDVIHQSLDTVAFYSEHPSTIKLCADELDDLKGELTIEAGLTILHFDYLLLGKYYIEHFVIAIKKTSNKNLSIFY